MREGQIGEAGNTFRGRTKKKRSKGVKGIGRIRREGGSGVKITCLTLNGCQVRVMH